MYFKDKADGFYIADYIEDGWIEISKSDYEGLNPVLPVSTPSEVSMRQARLALFDAGLLATVDEALSLIPIEEQRKKAQIEWEFSTTVNRNSALVNGLAGALGLTDEMLDNLFSKASKI